MKRIFAMLLCALLVCGMAAAVAEEPAATGKLVLYSPLTTSMIENMLAMFEADTGIKTECLAMGTGDALKRIAAESEKPQCTFSGPARSAPSRTAASISRIIPA